MGVVREHAPALSAALQLSSRGGGRAAPSPRSGTSAVAAFPSTRIARWPKEKRWALELPTTFHLPFARKVRRTVRPSPPDTELLTPRAWNRTECRLTPSGRHALEKGVSNIGELHPYSTEALHEAVASRPQFMRPSLACMSSSLSSHSPGSESDRSRRLSSASIARAVKRHGQLGDGRTERRTSLEQEGRKPAQHRVAPVDTVRASHHIELHGSRAATRAPSTATSLRP